MVSVFVFDGVRLTLDEIKNLESVCQAPVYVVQCLIQKQSLKNNQTTIYC